MDSHKDQDQARETVLQFLFTVTKSWSNGPVFCLLSVLFMFIELKWA